MHNMLARHQRLVSQCERSSPSTLAAFLAAEPGQGLRKSTTGSTPKHNKPAEVELEAQSQTPGTRASTGWLAGEARRAAALRVALRTAQNDLELRNKQESTRRSAVVRGGPPAGFCFAPRRDPHDMSGRNQSAARWGASARGLYLGHSARLGSAQSFAARRGYVATKQESSTHRFTNADDG